MKQSTKKQKWILLGIYPGKTSQRNVHFIKMLKDVGMVVPKISNNQSGAQ